MNVIFLDLKYFEEGLFENVSTFSIQVCVQNIPLKHNLLTFHCALVCGDPFASLWAFSVVLFIKIMEMGSL